MWYTSTFKTPQFNEGLETLGVFITIDGNQTGQLNNLREKSEVFAE